MLATQVNQKDGRFYFVSYKAADLLPKVHFTSRYYFEGEHLEAGELHAGDEVATFIAGVEKKEGAFQRMLNRRKIKEIVNFYENAASQPLIPGTILLFTPEQLQFKKLGHFGTGQQLPDYRWTASSRGTSFLLSAPSARNGHN